MLGVSLSKNPTIKYILTGKKKEAVTTKTKVFSLFTTQFNIILVK